MTMSPVMQTARASGLRDRFGRIAAGLLVATFAASSLTAQPASEPSGEVLKLSTFEVSGEKPNRYQASDVTSGGRVRTTIFDSPQTINVVTDALLKDVGAVRILDALKYIPGVTESTIPNGLDRLTVRGFQIDGATIDGFYDITQANVDPVLIDRIEVIKGPNAILSPTGSPGGTVNNVTKKPLFVDPQNTVRLEYGVFDAGSIEVDSTGRIGDANSKFAYRVVASYRDYDSYYGNTGTKRHTFAPSLSYMINPSTKLTVQAEFSDSKAGGYLGMPIDPSVGSTNEAILLAGVSPTAAIYADDIYRRDKKTSYQAFLTSELTEHLSVRVAARQNEYYLDDQSLVFNAIGGAGGARNPLTGLWTPGVIYGAGPTFTPSPAPVPSRSFTRSGNHRTAADKTIKFQNDWVYKRTFGGVQSTTGAGFAYGRREPAKAQGLINETLSNTPLDFDNIVLTPLTPTGTISIKENIFELTKQYYANQSLGIMKDRVILSGGVSRFDARNSTIRLLPGATNVYIDNNTSTVNYGLVIKPTKDISLFYGHSENASPVSTNASPVGTPDFSVGEQNEFGARVRLLEGRLQVSATYFDITQSAFSVPNPANLVFPPPVPPAPLLFSDRAAKGWELEFTFEVSKGFTIIGNYTDFTNRDPNDVPFRGTAETSGAAWARYEFLKGSLRGWNISIGSNYIGERPGDGASGFTAASTPTNLIPNQPSFYLPSRTLVDLSFGYTREAWTVQANVDNLFDSEYLAAGLTRTLVYPGTGINFRVSLGYKF